MENNFSITIGRQYGSGGREIGELLAERLGMTFYDKELLVEAVKESGLEPEIFEQFDEKPTNSFFYSLLMGIRAGKIQPNQYDLALPEQVHQIGFDVIRKLAEEKSCIFIGRCADYALRAHPNCLKLFIYAPLDSRIERIQKRRNVDAQEAADLIRQTDKQRAAYYNYYSNQKWGAIGSYQLCIDSSLCGVEGTVDLLEQLVQKRKRA